MVKKMPHLEIIEVLLVHCNTVNIYTFIPNKPFDKFLDVSPENLIFFQNLWFRIFTHSSMVYWSKFYTSRDRRQNKHHFSY